jgi:signal peptidase I
MVDSVQQTSGQKRYDPLNRNEPGQSTPPGDSDLPQRQEAKRDVIEFVKLVVWFLVLFFVLRTYVIEGYEVQGPSMMPTLEDRERILVLKLPHILSHFGLFGGIEAIQPGDVIVFKSPDDGRKRYVKRVIARGPKRPGGKKVEAGPYVASQAVGESVSVRMEGNVIYVNNRRTRENYEVALGNGREEIDEALSPGEYFVLGDNRRVSKDSRSFGPLDEEQVIGKAVLRFWPLHRLSLLQ